jgi:hypothetical protein
MNDITIETPEEAILYLEGFVAGIDRALDDNTRKRLAVAMALLSTFVENERARVN